VIALSQKTAIVFGGSGGIGSAICRMLASQGFNVALTYRSNIEKAESLAEEIERQGANAIAMQADLNDPGAANAAVESTVKAYGGLSAGIYAAGPRIKVDYVSKLKSEEWRDVMVNDAEACFNAFTAALLVLKERRNGSLVAVTTTQINRNEKRGLLSAAPKAAIEMLSRAIAKEEAPNGIRANTVRAGWVDSQRLGAEMLKKLLSPKAYQAVIDEIPMSRFAHADEIAEAVCFLSSDKASYITGQSITVDGGMAL
jgi:3-oxoacyl-[acyl-carrier protein] reductase